MTIEQSGFLLTAWTKILLPGQTFPTVAMKCLQRVPLQDD